MRMRDFLLCVLLAAATVSAPAVSHARADISVGVVIGPPPPAVASRPAPRPGYVWVPGYWSWRGHRHVWVDGRWLRERRGYVWVPGYWARVHGHVDYRHR